MSHLSDDECTHDFDKLKSLGLTLVGRERYVNAIRCVEDVLERDIEGVVVECGTYKCGCIAGMTKASRGLRKIWGFDTFEGLPIPTVDDGDRARGRGGRGDLNAPFDEAHVAFDVVGIGMENVKLVKGLFESTLPQWKSEIGAIAVLRLDGDWYSSTMTCLEELYDSVVHGGWIIIDDYGHWQGCRKAVDEFMQSRGIDAVLSATDYTERKWMKE